MKKTFLVVCAFLLCLFPACCRAESPAEEETEAVSRDLTISGLFSGKSELSVGRDVAFEDITEFYYTYDASTAPPHYQRYRFYTEDEKKMFYHETREGGGWPQTEENITLFGTRELTREEWEEFCGYVEDGTVKNREESLDDGDAGPWMYLYWNGDKGECQEYSFASWGMQKDFEEFCEKLAGKCQNPGPAATESES